MPNLSAPTHFSGPYANASDSAAKTNVVSSPVAGVTYYFHVEGTFSYGSQFYPHIKARKNSESNYSIDTTFTYQTAGAYVLDLPMTFTGNSGDTWHIVAYMEDAMCNISSALSTVIDMTLGGGGGGGVITYTPGNVTGPCATSGDATNGVTCTAIASTATTYYFKFGASASQSCEMKARWNLNGGAWSSYMSQVGSSVNFIFSMTLPTAGVNTVTCQLYDAGNVAQGSAQSVSFTVSTGGGGGGGNVTSMVSSSVPGNFVSFYDASGSKVTDSGKNNASYAAAVHTHYSYFVSRGRSGTGAEETIAHGLGVVPDVVSVVLTNSGKTVYCRANATNVYVNVSSGETYTVSAIRFA